MPISYSAVLEASTPSPPARRIDRERERQQVAHAALVVILVGLCAAAAVLFVAGAKKNAEIDALAQRGVKQEAVVSSCVGLLGGSGSNAAGYACRARFGFHDGRYEVGLPDQAFHEPGSAVSLVVDPADPGLISMPAVLAHEHPSGAVFVVPSVLALLAVVVLAVILGRLGRGRQSVDALGGGLEARARD